MDGRKLKAEDLKF